MLKQLKVEKHFGRVASVFIERLIHPDHDGIERAAILPLEPL